MSSYRNILQEILDELSKWNINITETHRHTDTHVDAHRVFGYSVNSATPAIRNTRIIHQSLTSS
jgi:hypothetical protein